MIRHLAPRALRKGRDGRWHATRTDTIERRLDMLTTEGRKRVRPSGSREASRIAHHHNAVGAFIRRHPKGERDLARFKGGASGWVRVRDGPRHAPNATPCEAS